MGGIPGPVWQRVARHAGGLKPAQGKTTPVPAVATLAARAQRAGPRSGLPEAAAAGPPSMIFDTLRVAVIMMDITGRIVLWSPQAQEMLGWPAERVVGRLCSSLLDRSKPSEYGCGYGHGGPPRAGTVPPPGPTALRFAHLMRTGSWDGVLPLRHRDGHTVQTEVRASLLADEDSRPFVLSLLADIGQVQDVEHDLATQDATFDSSPLGVAILDTRLRFTRVNDAMARMNGLPAEAHIGHTPAELFDCPSVAELVKSQRQVLETGEAVVDMTASDPTGSSFRSISMNRLEDRSGRVHGVACTAMDVTERLYAAAAAERTRERLALLNDVGSRIADLLDMHRITKELVTAVVPRFSDYSGAFLRESVVAGGDLPREPHSPETPVVQVAVAARGWSPQVAAMLAAGDHVKFFNEGIYAESMRTGQPRLVRTQEELCATTFPGDPKADAAIALGIHSLLALPLRARGIVLGLFAISRGPGREPFDEEDMAFAMEIADRAGASLDNARLYAREREAAVTLQRSLLPQQVPGPPGVEVCFRYVPGSGGNEVGGDWFDVFPLARGRVAFVIGDVTGHGLRAAATMGQLRTAVRTLAALDLPPAKLLGHLNDLADDISVSPDEPLMATCLYAVYDPAQRRCTMAKAGHLPPVLVSPGTSEAGYQGAYLLRLPSGAPLGVGGVAFESVELDVPDGSVLVLYTDGLVETRGEDISAGLDRLRALLSRPFDSLDHACDDILTHLEQIPEPEDDVALLMARLAGIPDSAAVSWSFPAEPSAVGRARALVRDTLANWALYPLCDPAELMVSELVTNALRYARGPIGVRMVRGASLVVEVSDPILDMPRERRAGHEDEGGRGLQLVSKTAYRWGTRQGTLGKVVWFELPLPGS